MNAILQTAPTDDTSPGFARVLFGRSHDGFPVALVGDNAFAMVPGTNGRHYLATGWRIARPLDEWTGDVTLTALRACRWRSALRIDFRPWFPSQLSTPRSPEGGAGEPGMPSVVNWVEQRDF